MGKLNLSEWNIRGAASMGWNNEYEIKDFVVDEIVNKNVDIFILLEFVVTKGWDYFQSKLKEKNYAWFMTSTSSQNGILIAIKKDIEGLNLGDLKNYKENKISTEMNSGVADKPDFLQIEVNYNNKPLTIIGTRIRDCDNLAPQFKALNDHLDTLPKDNKVICTGDFNAYRPYLMNHLPFFNGRIFPDWYQHRNEWSFVHKSGDRVQIDLLAVKGVTITNEKYHWDFVNKDNGYDDLNPEDDKSKLKGYPDHAILNATIEI